ncbi:MAG TPA: tetratricopeptide repeat protein [Longimicrobiales bacterium]
MIEPSRVLGPLREAGDAIRRLGDYDTPAALAQAIQTSWKAVERCLRLLLRADPDAPDAARLRALTPEDLPVRELIEVLRRRDLISIALAGTALDLERAAERAATGHVRAADADLAAGVIERLRTEVTAMAGPGIAAAAPVAEQESPPVASPPEEPRVRPINITAAVLALLVLAALVLALFRALDDSMDEAVAAFEAGRLEASAAAFRAVVQDAPDNVTARLYLARIYRRGERYHEAAEQLRAAATIDPDDPDVRRELGHLFLDLGRPDAAAEQYRRAVEAAPGDELGWIGWVRALRIAGDPSAADVLRRAPPAARAALSSHP